MSFKRPFNSLKHFFLSFFQTVDYGRSKGSLTVARYIEEILAETICLTINFLRFLFRDHLTFMQNNARLHNIAEIRLRILYKNNKKI